MASASVLISLDEVLCFDMFLSFVISCLSFGILSLIMFRSCQYSPHPLYAPIRNKDLVFLYLVSCILYLVFPTLTSMKNVTQTSYRRSRYAFLPTFSAFWPY